MLFLAYALLVLGFFSSILLRGASISLRIAGSPKRALVRTGTILGFVLILGGVVVGSLALPEGDAALIENHSYSAVLMLAGMLCSEFYLVIALRKKNTNAEKELAGGREVGDL